MSQVPASCSPALPGSTPGPDWLRGWSRPAQLAAAFLLGCVVSLLVVYILASSRWTARPTELEPGPGFDTRIDVNLADRVDLLQLPGVGPSLAEKIENDRRERGPFRDLADLTRVHGVGSTTVER